MFDVTRLNFFEVAAVALNQLKVVGRREELGGEKIRLLPILNR